MTNKQEEIRYNQEEDMSANSEQFEYLLPRPILGGKEYVWDFGGWVEIADEPLI